MALIEPNNETHLIWLFTLYHKDYGFSDILNIGTFFPDVIAIRDGKKLKIEFEYKLSGFFSHYCVDSFEGYYKFYPKARRLEWRKINNMWKKFDLETDKEIISDKYKDTDNELEIDNKTGGLCYKTLKDDCDLVFCWLKDCEPRENIEVIYLCESISKHRVNEKLK